MNVLEILESNLKAAEEARDLRAIERIRRNIDFMKSRSVPANDSGCAEQKS